MRRTGFNPAALVLLLAATLLCASAAPAAAADPPDVSAPSAIVVELSTGDVAFERRADERRPIASVTKLMTALLTLEGRRLSDTVTATRYAASAVESQIKLRAGEKLTVADMLRGLLLASANDAAAALATEVGGSRRAFVRAMNRRARELGLPNTRFADPIGLDAGNRSSARDLVGLTLQLRRFGFARKTVDRAGATLESGDRQRTITNRNTLVRAVPWVSGVKTGHTARAGYVLVGSATRRGITLVSVVLGTPSEGARNADTLALLRYGFGQYSRRLAVRRGAVLARAPINFRRGAELDLVAARTVRRVVRRGQRPRVRVTSAAREVSGPIRKGQRLGTADVLVGSERVGTVALVAAAPVPAASAAQKTKDYVTRPLGFVLALLAVSGSVALRGAPQVVREPPALRPKGGGDVIITVTLNTAVDKTLAVPNFRLGRRHRTVEQTTMPGGKGVNVARVLKTLGQPVIATGLAGGATGTRIVEQLTQLSVLSDFVRIREESRTNTAVIDPTTGEQTEINERGPAVSEAEVEMFVDKLLYLAQGASLCVFAGSLPRQVDTDVYARLIPELRRLGVETVVDTDGDPLRRAVRAEPDVISPNMLEAEELVGHEFNDEEDQAVAVREMVELGAREAIMTAGDGCYALMAPEDRPAGPSPAPGHAEPVLYRVRGPALEPRSTVGSGDAFLAGFVAARYLGRPVADSLAYGVAVGAESTQHLGAGIVDPGRVERILAEVSVERPVLSAEVG